MKVGWDKRFRKNLDEFVHLDRLEDGSNNDGDQQQKKQKGENYADQDEEESERQLAITQKIIQKEPIRYGANE
jgi:hypothetical protein